MATISKPSKSKVVIVPKPPVSGTQDTETSKSTTTSSKEEVPAEKVEEATAKKGESTTSTKSTVAKTD